MENEIIDKYYKMNKKCMLFSDFFKQNGFILFIGITIIMIYCIKVTTFHAIFINWDFFNNNFSRLYRLIEQNFIFNIWLFFSLILFAFFSCKSLLDSKGPMKPIIGIVFGSLAVIILLYKNNWVFASFCLSYKYWLSFVFIFIIGLSFYLIKKWWKTISDDSLLSGNSSKPFTTDSPIEGDNEIKWCSLFKCIRNISDILRLLKDKLIAQFNRGKNNSNQQINQNQSDSDTELTIKVRKQLAADLLARINKTEVAREPFALCITGSWGAGKTSFLNYYKSLLINSSDYERKKIDYIEFHPWDSSSSSQIINDFFKLLSNKLSYLNIGLEKAISNYIKLLLQFNENAGKGLSSMLGVVDEFYNQDLESQKSLIYERLSIINRKWHILIDDLDRLDGKEILSVLQLIRNTAKFPNLIFVVTLDKDYTCSHLEDVNFKDGKDYLEKIFQIEIKLPKIDNNDVIQSLINEIKTNWNVDNISLEDFISELRKLSVDEETNPIIFETFTNFRIIKRFARHFSISASILQYNLGDKLVPFDLIELFFIELLGYINAPVYNELSRTPWKLLKYTESKQLGAFWYLDKLPDNTERRTSFILNYLFKKTKDSSSNKMALRVNYYNYFCLAQPSDMLSISEFQSMINQSPETIESKVQEWFNFETRKNADSIFFCFRKTFIEGRKYKTNYMKSLLHFALFWSRNELQNVPYIVNTFSLLLNRTAYKEANIDEEIVRLVEDKIIFFINENINLINHYTTILTNLYRFDNVYNNQVLKNDKIQALIDTVLFSRLIESKSIDAQNLLWNGSDLNRFAKCAVVVNSKSHKSKSLVIDSVISYFSDSDRKSRYIYKLEQQFPDLIKIESKTRILFLEKKETQSYDSQVKEVKNVFGSNWQDNFQRYVELCFDLENATPHGSRII